MEVKSFGEHSWQGELWQISCIASVIVKDPLCIGNPEGIPLQMTNLFKVVNNISLFSRWFYDGVIVTFFLVLVNSLNYSLLYTVYANFAFFICTQNEWIKKFNLFNG